MGSTDNASHSNTPPNTKGATSSASSLPDASENIARMARRYGMDEEGKLGKKSYGGSNQILSANPGAEAKRLFDGLSAGGVTEISDTSTGKSMTRFDNGDVITYRPVTSGHSPAVDVNAKSFFGEYYKIHFEDLNKPERKKGRR